MEEQEYKGYKIKKSTDPWALKYGYEWSYYIDVDAKVHLCKTEQECKDEIDEKTFYNN